MARILGISKDRTSGRCFVEIRDAVTALTNLPVCFMAHVHVPPAGSIVYHWENGPLEHEATLAVASEIWDFSARNTARYPESVAPLVRCVPCGHHPSMERFEPSPEPEFDVAWFGSINARRFRVLRRLRREGLSVIEVPGTTFGRARDRMIARARVVLNMRYYEDGLFPVLRSAHATANLMPCIAEDSPEIPSWVSRRCGYDDIPTRVAALARASPEHRRAVAHEAREMFRAQPLVLPLALGAPSERVR